MDNVLNPNQNGKPVDKMLVTKYMSGLLGSAVLAWILGWGKTSVLDLVSERIGAD
jgi:ATP-binding cassette subfamily B protein